MARRTPLDAASIAADLRRTEAVLSAASRQPVRIAVRRACGDYRAADYLGGAFFALFVLLASALRAIEGAPSRAPVIAALAFGVGALATAHLAGLRRPLAGRARQRAHVLAAAASEYVAGGHQGVLVFLAMFERDAALIGTRDPAVHAQLARVREAMRVGTPSLVLAAVESLAPYLGDGASTPDDDDLGDGVTSAPDDDDHDAPEGTPAAALDERT